MKNKHDIKDDITTLIVDNPNPPDSPEPPEYKMIRDNLSPYIQKQGNGKEIGRVGGTAYHRLLLKEKAFEKLQGVLGECAAGSMNSISEELADLLSVLLSAANINFPNGKELILESALKIRKNKDALAGAFDTGALMKMVRHDSYHINEQEDDNDR